MSISKKQHKLITSLKQKKYRQKNNLFIAEGFKVVDELLNSSIELERLFMVEDCEINNIEESKIQYVTEKELNKVSFLKTPNKVLGIFKIPKEVAIKQKGLIVALDEVNDPGNLGTIIRLCDWFGVSQLVCSKTTVDCYNQKVIQSTMGSITRVQINYVDLGEFLENTPLKIYAADMDGENVYDAVLPNEAVIVMGNEANGISETIEKIISNRLTIPRFGTLQKTESLNVATATSILLSEFKRRLK